MCINRDQIVGFGTLRRNLFQNASESAQFIMQYMEMQAQNSTPEMSNFTRII